MLGLPASWAAARTALRLTAEGTDDDPGPRVVYADEVGGLALLARCVGPATPPLPDVLALEQAAAAAPWMLVTLHAVATSASLRAAAAALSVHHSTLQDRIATRNGCSAGRCVSRRASSASTWLWSCAACVIIPQASRAPWEP